MHTLTRRWIGIGTIALALPLAATAQQAFTRGGVDLRAGPGDNYPLVASLAPGQPLQVMGCTNGYGWCDVVWSRERPLGLGAQRFVALIARKKE